jgi:enoyl-CoA hydratase/carnithine racemase
VPDPTDALVATVPHGHIALITLQRTEKHNAVDQALADALSAALDELDDDPELWAGVLTGSPAAFSAGTDISLLGFIGTERGGEYGIIRRERTKPLIAAVEGIAFGGGMEMALACDLVVAATNARFGLPEVHLGLVPTCGGLFRSARSLPLNLARELVLTGDPISAERAHGAGFVNVLTEPGGAVEGALALAERIVANGPLAVRECLRAINGYVGADDAVGWAATEAAKAVALPSDDAREGVQAFFEKRPPRWQGA